MENEKDKIKNWLKANIERCTGHKYLSEDQVKEITNKLSFLMSNVPYVEDRITIEDGNAVLQEMNDMINETRRSSLPTKEDFVNKMYGESDGMESHRFVQELFGDMLDLKMYDEVIEYLEALDFYMINNRDGLASLRIATNHICPLLRPIPKKESVETYEIKRYQFFERCSAYFKEKYNDGENGFHKILMVSKPGDYDERVKSFDQLYLGGSAPKEK